MHALSKDLRYAVRTLSKNPGYTTVALATLALGIGANTAIFSVINQVLLNPAGVQHPERVVAIQARYTKLALNNIGVSVPDFADVLHSRQQFDSAALINQGNPIVPLAIGNLIQSEVGLSDPGQAKALALGMVIIVAIVMVSYAVLQRRTARWLR